MTVIKYVKSDLYRITGKVNAIIFIRNYIFNRSFNFLFWFRLASRGGRVVSCFSYPIYKYKKIKYGIDISHHTDVGYGLYIGHGGPIIINPSAKIGNNVNVSQYTTIGANDGVAAKISDNVYIGPNCCIIENVCIGECATIGAGSVVTKDIPANATAVGNYAKVVNYNNPGRYIKNRWVLNK